MTLGMKWLWQGCEEKKILMRLMSSTGGSGGVSNLQATPLICGMVILAVYCVCVPCMMKKSELMS